MTKAGNSQIMRKITLLITIFSLSLPACAQYSGGTGEPNDPYLIFTAEQMNEIGLHEVDWDKHFKLMADIDLSAYTGTQFNIIGRWFGFNHPDNKGFGGVFDGSGKKISNFSYTSTGANNIGLFEFVADPNAQIKDLGLIDPNVDAGTGSYVGSLVGRLSFGIITGCYAEGGSVSGNHTVGGLVGRNNGTITNCYSLGSVSGDDDVGGLVGFNSALCTIIDCYAISSVSGDDRVGGLVGRNNTNGTITNCSAGGAVLGDREVGGLVGRNCYATITNSCSTGSVSGSRKVGGLVGNNDHGTITNCYSTGSITGSEEVGGLVGAVDWGGGFGGHITNCYSTSSVSGNHEVAGLVGDNEGAITNSYSVGRITGTTDIGGLVGINNGQVTGSFWDIQTSGLSTSAGGTGKTTSQMQIASTFVGWGCGLVWTIDEGANYPRLAWENTLGQMLTTPSFPTVAGSGTENDPYLIYTAEQLNAIGLFPCELDKHFKLMADIDLNGFTGTEFNIIGNDKVAFTGVFDGNGHTISNFTYNLKRDFVGIFGKARAPARIEALGLINPNINAGWYTGSLVGDLGHGTAGTIGTITNCYVVAGRITGGRYVGGLAGRNLGIFTITNCDSSCSVRGNLVVGGLVGQNYEVITNCYATGSVSGESWVGGLVGAHASGIITNCYATGSVSFWGNDKFFGGLVGLNGSTITNCYSLGSVLGNTLVGGLAGRNLGTITNCFATGDVTGQDKVGGLVGLNALLVSANDAIYKGKITNCYSVGRVTGWTDIGGLLGFNDGFTVSNSFWDIQTSGQTTSAGGTAKTTIEMQSATTFLDAGWDFMDEIENGTENIWWIDEGQDYPRLWWEPSD